MEVRERIEAEGARVVRRLAAIMSGDVVAYSRLMAEDEEATVRRLGACREHMRLLVERHRGRVVDFIGDNFLAEFSSVVDAVTCALLVQEGFRSSNEALPKEQRMEFRLGLHLGEVRVEDGQLYGNGVNIAARLQSLADPGGICVSQVVAREITGRIPVACDDLGERSVKNIPDAIRVFRLSEPGSERLVPASAPHGLRQRRARDAAPLVLFAVLLAFSPGFSAIARDPEGLRVVPASTSAIAILPFTDLSAAQDERYFAEGLVEQLTHTLANVRSLRVAARLSAFAVTREGRDVRTIGHLLDAETVIEGSVRKAGRLLRVTVQAICVADGYHLWSKTYDCEEADVLTIQDKIARSVAEALTAAVEGEAVGPGLCGPDGERRPPAVHTTVRSEARGSIASADAG